MNPIEPNIDPEQLQARAAETAPAARESVHSALIQSEHAIRKNPLPALLLALAAGVALGALAFRREEKTHNVGEDVMKWINAYPGGFKKFKKSLPDMPERSALKKQARLLGNYLRFW